MPHFERMCLFDSRRGTQLFRLGAPERFRAKACPAFTNGSSGCLRDWSLLQCPEEAARQNASKRELQRESKGSAREAKVMTSPIAGGVDCDLHPAVPHLTSLLPYLNDYWRDQVST